MSQEDQHDVLDRIGVVPMLDPAWLLRGDDLARLKDAGWIVASYGRTHENAGKREALEKEFRDLSESVEKRGHMPWLAWPGGQWTQLASEAALAAGFHLQFGSEPQSYDPPSEGMVTRTINQ